ncbi:phosphoribosyltransferase family protein [Aquisalimonas sp.]|uniref:phosphoribosyltransferase n=1 Tax=Aquisalimonas sp. TaxID=1872621 RepID=UPI0025C6A31F|nr:phosphoribosyltransferase family protein [Aquisalimonas sp.]
MYKDREEAAESLARELAAYQGQNPLVLAIPRGAAPMAAYIARALDGELDVVLAHKLGAPGNPEFAVGAVSEDGSVHVADHARRMGIDEDYLRHEAKKQLQTIRERRQRYTPVREAIDPGGRIVIVVDDGIATGSTMLAALRAVRAQGPARLIAAVGVAPPDACERLRAEADEVVCPLTPQTFQAVGQFFRQFDQVTDDQVVSILAESSDQ